MVSPKCLEGEDSERWYGTAQRSSVETRKRNQNMFELSTEGLCHENLQENFENPVLVSFSTLCTIA